MKLMNAHDVYDVHLANLLLGVSSHAHVSTTRPGSDACSSARGYRLSNTAQILIDPRDRRGCLSGQNGIFPRVNFLVIIMTQDTGDPVNCARPFSNETVGIRPRAPRMVKD